MDFCGESGLQLVCVAVFHLMICLPLSFGFLWRIWSTRYMCCCPPSHDMPATVWWISVQNLDYTLYVLLSSISWYTCQCLIDFCAESGLEIVCATVLHLMVCLPRPDGFLCKIFARTHMWGCPASHDIAGTAWWISVQNMDYKLYVLLSSVSWYTGPCLIYLSGKSGLQPVCAAVLHL